MSNIKRISKEIFAISSAIKIQLFASKVIFVIVAAPIANNRGNISHVFDTISEEESISSKKGGERGRTCSMDSLKLESNWGRG